MEKLLASLSIDFNKSSHYHHITPAPLKQHAPIFFGVTFITIEMRFKITVGRRFVDIAFDKAGASVICHYNLYIYGTTDQSRIGLSVSLISRLQADGQLSYLYFDQFNNSRAMFEFEQYKASASDFYRFEIECFL